MLAHLCRCTGWQPIVDGDHVGRRSWPRRGQRRPRVPTPSAAPGSKGSVAQSVGPEVALGRGGFADDTAPAEALVAVRDTSGAWVVGETLAEARAS